MLEQATQALPEFAPAHLGLALTYEQLGEFELALETVEYVLELNPDDFAAQQTYGRIQMRLE